MTIQVRRQNEQPLWQISLGAEGIAAAQFARCGFDVSIQHGADKPAYDMIVSKGSSLLKVAVKGSADGSWNLTQSFIKRAAGRSEVKADYHAAIDLWLDKHGSRSACCLVQFLGVAVDQLPRIYLATPQEIAVKLRESAEGRGESVLWEGNEWACAEDGAGPGGELPAAWRFSIERIHELLARRGTEPALRAITVKVASTAGIWTSSVSQPVESQAILAV